LDDTDAAAGARKCLQALDGSAGQGLSAAAVRLLAQAKPAGAAAALLDFLPQAEDDGVADEVGRSLQAVALRDGKLDPAVPAALKAPVPARRALAAEVMSRAGGAAGREAVRGLLKDDKPTVRLRAALALAEARDADAVTVLIDLLA